MALWCRNSPHCKCPHGGNHPLHAGLTGIFCALSVGNVSCNEGLHDGRTGSWPSQQTTAMDLKSTVHGDLCQGLHPPLEPRGQILEVPVGARSGAGSWEIDPLPGAPHVFLLPRPAPACSVLHFQCISEFPRKRTVGAQESCWGWHYRRFGCLSSSWIHPSPLW